MWIPIIAMYYQTIKLLINNRRLLKKKKLQENHSTLYGVIWYQSLTQF